MDKVTVRQSLASVLVAIEQLEAERFRQLALTDIETTVNTAYVLGSFHLDGLEVYLEHAGFDGFDGIGETRVREILETAQDALTELEGRRYRALPFHSLDRTAERVYALVSHNMKTLLAATE